MPDTATARIADFASAAAIDHGADWMITIWRGRALYLGDLAGLIERLREACPDCGCCELCETWLCETCVVGQPARCDSLFAHCEDCWSGCRSCAREVDEDARAEMQADASGGRV